jgi:hypothetical protein
MPVVSTAKLLSYISGGRLWQDGAAAGKYGMGVSISISEHQKTDVFCHVRLKTIDIVPALIKRGLDPHRGGHFGRTVLYHHAAAYNARSYGSIITTSFGEIFIAGGTRINRKRGSHGRLINERGAASPTSWGESLSSSQTAPELSV